MSHKLTVHSEIAEDKSWLGLANRKFLTAKDGLEDKEEVAARGAGEEGLVAGASGGGHWRRTHKF